MTASLGARIKAEVEAWARFSAEEGKLTRVFLSPEHAQVAAAVTAAMTAAGMRARIDAIGNVVGRYEGATPNAPALLTGSHVDTVRDAGPYDGNLGVALPIACIAELNTRGQRLPFAIEVIAFGDEEGVRFPTVLSGSRAIAGTFDSEVLSVCDSDGVTLADALRAFGCRPEEIPAEARRPADVIGFVEVHIEQGPVLEREGLPVGIVTAINGASRFRLSVHGMAGHAGTVPMAGRQDALVGAAEMILAIERRAQADDTLVATVGQLSADPGAVNVIPGRADFTVDIRAPEDTLRQRAIADVRTEVHVIAQRRGLTVTMDEFHDQGAVACDPWLMDALAASVTRCGYPVHRLPSGAGHDAMAVAALCPMAMLFIRCGGGISHNPAETITAEDVEAAARVFLDFLEAGMPLPASGPGTNQD